MSTQGGQRRGQLWIHLLLIPLCALTLYPVLWVVGLALSPGEAHLGQGLWPLPAHLSVEHFTALLGSRDAGGRFIFLRQLMNSLVVAAPPRSGASASRSPPPMRSRASPSPAAASR